jgi:hypothetical protein
VQHEQNSEAQKSHTWSPYSQTTPRHTRDDTPQDGSQSIVGSQETLRGFLRHAPHNTSEHLRMDHGNPMSHNASVTRPRHLSAVVSSLSLTVCRSCYHTPEGKDNTYLCSRQYVCSHLSVTPQWWCCHRHLRVWRILCGRGRGAGRAPPERTPNTPGWRYRPGPDTPRTITEISTVSRARLRNKNGQPRMITQ